MLTDSVVLKENHIQMITDQLGNIPPTDAANFGLYYFDTRHLSGYELLVNGVKPLYLSHTADRNYIATFQFVNPNMVLPDGSRVPRQTISIRRTRFVDGRTFQERLGFFNCNHFAVDLEVTLSFECDFRDMFAVRGYVQQRLAGYQNMHFDQKKLTFSYVGRDKVLRHTDVKFDRPAEPLSAESVLFRLHLEPHTPVSLSLYVRPSVGRAKPLRAPTFDRNLEVLARSYAEWDASCTRIQTNNEYFDRSLLRQSRLDVRSLLEFDSLPAKGAHLADAADSNRFIVPSAGIPWYAVPFGRDAIITALQTLVYNPKIAEGTLRFLAHYQGTKINPATDEEPGKIFHEIRRGELANLREVPHLPYYGTVDATPLFVILFAETYRWTGSEELYRDLLPHALRAVEWCDKFGDVDGDGYVEYQPRSEGGVLNHGWKDSWDSLQYEDGRVAKTPAALVEVQGYVYRAKTDLSQLLEEHGDTTGAARLQREAAKLRARLNKDFWLQREGYLAQALDANKQPVAAITSNAGHCLWSEVVEPELAEQLVRRMMEPDMFSGWGVRTLSSASANYNPMSYHNGSVWPHDNSIIALGMLRYGCVKEAASVISAVIEAGLRFPSNRLPELFCGFSRDRRFNSSPMAYIKSCSPQAWAAAAPFLFLQTLLNVHPENRGQVLWVSPLPTGLFARFSLECLRVGDQRVSLCLRQRDDRFEMELLEGDVELRSYSAEAV